MKSKRHLLPKCIGRAGTEQAVTSSGERRESRALQAAAASPKASQQCPVSRVPTGQAALTSLLACTSAPVQQLQVSARPPGRSASFGSRWLLGRLQGPGCCTLYSVWLQNECDVDVARLPGVSSSSYTWTRLTLGWDSQGVLARFQEANADLLGTLLWTSCLRVLLGPVMGRSLEGLCRVFGVPCHCPGEGSWLPPGVAITSLKALWRCRLTLHAVFRSFPRLVFGCKLSLGHFPAVTPDCAWPHGSVLSSVCPQISWFAAAQLCLPFLPGLCTVQPSTLPPWDRMTFPALLVSSEWPSLSTPTLTTQVTLSFRTSCLSRALTRITL